MISEKIHFLDTCPEAIKPLIRKYWKLKGSEFVYELNELELPDTPDIDLYRMVVFQGFLTIKAKCPNCSEIYDFKFVDRETYIDSRKEFIANNPTIRCQKCQDIEWKKALEDGTITVVNINLD